MNGEPAAGDRGAFRFEHVALNLSDPEAFARWYVDNLGLEVVHAVPGEKSFLADGSGAVVFELYDNSGAPHLQLREVAPLSFHVAFAVDDISAAAARLVEAGAEVVQPLVEVDGDRLIMLRDPFGLSLQLVRRRAPMAG